MNNSKYKIVVSGRDVIGTGGGTVVLETVKNFVKLGHDVCLVVDYKIPSITGVSIVVTPFGQTLKNWTPKSQIMFKIKHCLQLISFSIFGRIAVSRLEKKGYVSIDHNGEAFGGDIVVLHNVFIEQFYADQRSLLKKIPQFFNPVFSFRLLRERVILRSRNTKVIVAVSDSTAQEAKPISKSSIPIVVIESGINIDRFILVNQETRNLKRKNLGFNEKFITLFVGHEFERKRLDLVIQAMRLLPEQHMLLVIGGRMSNVNSYIDMCNQLGVQNRVQFLGTVSDAERYFEIADAFVLPSNYETWGLVCLEAMACGVPVIMTPVGCASKVIINNENGFIIDYSYKQIAEKLSLLESNNGLRHQFRVNARKKAEEHTWENVAKLYLAQVQYTNELVNG